MLDLHPSLECLETVVGLSRNDCPCIESGRPEEYSNSLSGLYMDDYEHGLAYIFPKSAKDCGDGSVWDVLGKARIEGINDWLTHLYMAIGKNRNSFVDGFSGEFGEVNRRKNNSPDKSNKKNILGMVFTPNVYKGASVRIKNIWLAVDTAGDYTIRIHDLADFTTTVADQVISHDGGFKMQSVEFNETLPLSEAGQQIRYAISYERNGAFPLDYTFYCGCGESYKPQWMKSKYFDAQGFGVNDLSELFGGAHAANRKYTGGLIVEWEMICDPGAWICQQDESFWTATNWGRIAAKAMQLVQTTKSISAILDTGRVNFYTMISAEALTEKKQKCIDLAMELFDFLGSNMPEDVNHCWRCKPEQDFKKFMIKV